MFDEMQLILNKEKNLDASQQDFMEKLSQSNLEKLQLADKICEDSNLANSWKT